ncbi:hypothetical protein pb186bvf_011544 [Paramecium bursaria]
MKQHSSDQTFKYRVLENKNKKIIIETDEDQFNQFTQALMVIQKFHDDIKQQKLDRKQVKQQQDSDSERSAGISNNQPTADIKEDQDFRRRIPHFFLSRFKKWAKMMDQEPAYKYLQNVQDSKTSKQQRFELGDLQRCFQVQVNEPKESKLCKSLLKSLFIQFLQNEATLQIIHYNKISSIEQKVHIQTMIQHKYISEIKNMIQEMYELKPFDSYLSSEKIQSRKRGNFQQNNQQEMPREEIQMQQLPILGENISNDSLIGFKQYQHSLLRNNSYNQ